MHGFLVEILGVRFLGILIEAFPAIGSVLLGLGGLSWLKHLKKHVHDQVGGDR